MRRQSSLSSAASSLQELGNTYSPMVEKLAKFLRYSASSYPKALVQAEEALTGEDFDEEGAFEILDRFLESLEEDGLGAAEELVRLLDEDIIPTLQEVQA